MAVRRGTAPTRLRHEVRTKNAAERCVFKVTYVNMTTTAFQSLAQDHTLAQLLVQLVAEWDAEYDLSVDGFAELEDERPGTCMALLEGWHKARTQEREGN